MLFVALVLFMGTAFAEVVDLTARAKLTKVQLIWTSQGENAFYEVYRRELPAIGFDLIGTTNSTYSTFLDTNVSVNKTYCYLVLYNSEASNEACITVRSRTRR